MSMPIPLRDSDRTKAAILHAAQVAFSTRGYGATGVRDITAAAGVNASLVSRYFGSKEKLFESALSELLDASVITNIEKPEFGRELVALFAQSEQYRVNVLPMLVLAAGDPVSRSLPSPLVIGLAAAGFSGGLFLGRFLGRAFGLFHFLFDFFRRHAQLADVVVSLKQGIDHANQHQGKEHQNGTIENQAASVLQGRLKVLVDQGRYAPQQDP